MKERPILFSGEMVRAILRGEKTQTRRIVKPQPVGLGPIHGLPIFEGKDRPCPYGVPGDRLWVKETWCQEGDGIWTPRNAAFGAGKILYRADEAEPKKGVWFPSIFMYRWASRILLEVVSVRVERLQDIDEDDCDAEGYVFVPIGYQPEPDGYGWYRELWREINGAESWNANPWVWVVEFKVVPQEPRP